MITEELKKLYCTYTGHEPEAIEELPSSGSNRRYFRLTGTPTLIGVSGTSSKRIRLSSIWQITSARKDSRATSCSKE